MKLSLAAAFVCAVGCGDQLHPESLVDVVAEPPGANCPNGGEAVSTGTDTNNDGVLDPAEVARTSYICAGANGQQPLVRVDAEPAGEHCSAGGSAIRVGVDSNGDGELEDSEVTSTTYVCDAPNPTVIDGSFVVHNSIDAAQLVGVTEITGDLTIDAAGLSSLDLSALHHLGGKLDYLGFSGTTLALPALTSTGSIYVNGDSTAAPLELPALTTTGSIMLGASRLTTFELPALTTTGDMIVGGGDLVSATFPALTSAGDIFVSGSPVLTTLDISHVTTAHDLALVNDLSLTAVTLNVTAVTGTLRVQWTPLTALDVPSLTTVRALTISNMSELVSVDFSSLQTIRQQMYIGFTSVTALAFPALTSVASEATGGGVASIGYNPTLASFIAPLWTSFGPTPATAAVQIDFYSNPALPSCSAQALVDQMGALNAYVYANGNDDSAVCP